MTSTVLRRKASAIISCSTRKGAAHRRPSAISSRRATVRTSTSSRKRWSSVCLFSGPQAIGVRVQASWCELRRARQSRGDPVRRRRADACNCSSSRRRQSVRSSKAHGIDRSCMRCPASARTCRITWQFRLMFRCKKPITTNDDLASWRSTIGIGLRYAVQAQRPDGGRHRSCGHVRRALAHSQTPDVQFHIAAVSAEQAGGKTHPWPGLHLQRLPAPPGLARFDPYPVELRRRRAGDQGELSHQGGGFGARAVAGVRLAQSLAAAPSMRDSPRPPIGGPGRRRRRGRSRSSAGKRGAIIFTWFGTGNGSRRDGRRRSEPARARPDELAHCSTHRSCPRWYPATRARHRR